MKRLLAVSASAGSGKTFRLANRYISLLNIDNPSNIIAITFTNKAANEMKERIIKFLNDLGNDEAVIEMICNEVNLTKDELLKKKSILLKKFLTNDISIQTIDSFINKILRKFSFYAGVKANFDIGSDNKELIFKNFLLSLSDFEFNELVKIAKQEEKFSSLINLFESLYEKDKELKEIKSEKLKVKSESVENIYKEIETIKNNFILATDECKQVNNFFRKNVYEMLKVKTIPSFLEKGSLKNVRGFKKCYEEWMDGEFERLIELIRKFFLLKEEQFFKNLFYFYEKYKSEKWKFKKEENLLDFKDIEHLVFYLLQEKEIDRDFLYFRLDSKINHILMDEFQDTSVTQWEIFEPLIDEIASGVGVKENRSFFYVGDVKQAIYRFRGGAKELFFEVAKKYKDRGIEIESLDTNYRSDKNIVEFVNEKFNLNEKVHSSKDGYVEVDEITKEDAFEKMYEKIEMLNAKGVEDRDIAILVYKNDDILDVGEFLESKGKKVVTAKKAKVISQPFAKAVISLMKYLNNKNRIHKLNFLSLIGKKWNDEEFDIKITRPILMIKEIMDKYDLTDESTLKLLEYSRVFDTLDDFVEEIDNYDEELPLKEFDGIVVMTIHKSKGLEFPHVIVMDRLSKENSNKSNILYYYEDAKLKKIKLKIQNREFVDSEYKYIKEKEDVLEYEDKKNVEYVAFTRAIHSLIILKRAELTKTGKSYSAFVTNLEKMKKGEIIASQKKEKKLVMPKKWSIKNYGIQEVLIQEEEYKPNDYEAIYFGNALHFAFECEDIEAVRNHFGDFCDIEKVNELYKLSKKQLQKGVKEIPFIYEKKVGRIDLLIEKDDEIVIIDYKSTKPNDERGYIKQIEHYISFVKNLTSKKVKGRLFYIDSLEFREIKE